MANTGSGDGPLALHGEAVRPEWVDYNGHMNVAYYVLAFDHATDALHDHLDVGVAYRQRTDRTTFVVEAHVTYEREMLEGHRLRVTTQVLGHDAKRLHVFHRMYHADGEAAEEPLAATNELMLVHVDLTNRRSAPFPPPVLKRIETLAAAHAALPRPPQAGRVMGIESKPSG